MVVLLVRKWGSQDDGQGTMTIVNEHKLILNIHTDPKKYVRLYFGDPARLPIPSVILQPISTPGGIGDQLYRYAFAYTVARDLNTTLYLVQPSRELTRRRYGRTDRMFVLDKFQLDQTRVRLILEPTLNAISYNKKLYLDEVGPWRPHQLPTEKIIVVTEYFQSDMYFHRYRTELMDQLLPVKSATNEPRLQDLANAIRDSVSVAVHVRRRDFTRQNSSSAFNRALPISYQIRGIELVQYLLDTRREPGSAWLPIIFFVFSDDIEYVRKHVEYIGHPDSTFIYVSSLGQGKKPLTRIEEFELMCLCKHHIIPNSGFSWWAAWLNPNPAKLVVAPFPRHRYRFNPGWLDLRAHKEDLYWNHSYPSTWMTINPFVSYEDMM